MILQTSAYLVLDRFNENLLTHPVAKLFRLSSPSSLHLIFSLDCLLLFGSRVVVVKLMFCLNKSRGDCSNNFQQHVSVENF